MGPVKAPFLHSTRNAPRELFSSLSTKWNVLPSLELPRLGSAKAPAPVRECRMQRETGPPRATAAASLTSDRMSVKRTVERPANRGVNELPPLEEVKNRLGHRGRRAPHPGEA